VIGQFPDSGAHARSGQKVALLPSAYEQTGCGDSTGLQECDPSQLTLNVSEGKPDYTGGGDDSLAVVKVAHVRGRSECAVNSPLTVSVVRGGAPMNQIVGNPMTLQMHASLAAGHKMVAGWLLGSWCGSRHSVVATASLEGVEASQSLKDLPYGGGCPTVTLYSLFKE
jgi:hypothetical protein